MKTIFWGICAAALLAAPALAQEQSERPEQPYRPSMQNQSFAHEEVEYYTVRSEKTGELKQIKVRRRYPPPEANVYVLPSPVIVYRGYGW